MKKYLLAIISLVILMSMMMFVGCEYELSIVKKTTTTTTPTTNVTPTHTTPTTTPTIPTTTPTTTPTTNDNGGSTDPVGDFTLGMGVVLDSATSSRLTMTFAAVVLDAEGKIVSCKIDAIYNGYNIDYDNEEIMFTNFQTKAELGYDYAMSKWGINMDNNGDGIVKEWFEQAQAFENYVVGMTVEEVSTMQTQFVNNYYISADDALLSAGCTIQITEFINAVVKACNDDQSVHFAAVDNFALGLAANSNDNGSNFDVYESRVKMNIDFATVVVVNGKIVATLNDAAQPQIYVDEDGNVSNTIYNGTNRELKENHMMDRYGIDNNGDGIVLAWYLQSAAFSAHIVGMTGAEVAAMETTLVNNHYISTDADLLAAGCSIQITGFMDVVSEAANNAR